MKKASIRLGRSQRRRTEFAFKSFKQFKPFKTSVLGSLIKKSEFLERLERFEQLERLEQTRAIIQLPVFPPSAGLIRALPVSPACALAKRC